MPRIRCHYEDCIFLEAGYCTAEKIELDPETGCLTYQQADEAEAAAVGWEDEEDVLDEDEVEEEVELEEDDEDEEADDEEEW